jgi:gluconolactonase
MLNSPSCMTRRRFVASTAGATLAAAIPRASDASIAALYSGLDSDKYLGQVELLTRVEDREVFTEGPAVDSAGDVLFTNVRVSKILRWQPETKKLSVFREGTDNTNGLYFDREGRLLACEGGAGRVTRTDLETGKREVLADSFRGKKLAAPNDLCVDATGHIFFTSRSSTKDPPGENPKAVYRIDPGGELHQVLVWPDVHMPNGIVISPDNRTLYLIEAHPDKNHHRDLRAYDLRPDGGLANGRVIANMYPGRSGDGMCIDADGNLYVAAGLHKRRGSSETLDTKPGIHVFSPEGRLLAYRETPEDTVTNCTFGGSDRRTLYVTCGSLLLSIRTEIAGKGSVVSGL